MGTANANATTTKRNGTVRRMRLASIKPSPENGLLYTPINPDDPDIQAMAEDIARDGVKEPLIVSSDRWIISGHRRHAAAKLAGQATLPVRVRHDVSRERNRERFVKLLVQHNRHQRVKSYEEILREEAVNVDPEEAYQSLIEHRRANKYGNHRHLEKLAAKKRCRISAAKAPLLTAVQAIVENRKDFWPLSDRQIHYALLNAPPLIHASKPDSTYRNTPQSYKSLVDLLTRARLEKAIPWQALADPTRPVVKWEVWPTVQSFLRNELDTFGKGYWRDLLSTQPNQVEIVGEKNTIENIIAPVAMQYCIPYSISRGFSSLPLRYEIKQRFNRGGKDRLTLLFLTDHDPDGEEIARSFGRSMRDDFGLHGLVDTVRVALTAEQAEEYQLSPNTSAKKGSANYSRFVEKHGESVHELEALAPEVLQELLTEAIDSVIDTERFNRQLDREKEDAAFLETVRLGMKESLRGLTKPRTGTCPGSDNAHQGRGESG